MSQTIKVKRRAFSVVPDDILVDERLSYRTRILLAWMLGISPDFELRIWYIRKVFQLSEKQWRQARREMQSAGYFQQERAHSTGGKIVWSHSVTDTPAPPSYPKTTGWCTTGWLTIQWKVGGYTNKIPERVIPERI